MTGQRYGRWVGAAAVLIVLAAAISSAVSRTGGVTGVAPGRRVPPFAVPLAVGSLTGDANIATRADEGSAGRVPACTVRGSRVLNVCELYERGPLVLALFVEGGSCPAILTELERIRGSFRGVQFAAVAIKGSRGPLRRLIRAHHIGFPVGIDSDGALASLYDVASCPQVTFAYPGGLVQQRALLGGAGQPALSERVRDLVVAARARGWRPAR